MKQRHLVTYAVLALVWGLSFMVLVRVVAAFGWAGTVSFRALTAGGALLLVALLMRRRLDFGCGWKPLAISGFLTVVMQLAGIAFAAPAVGATLVMPGAKMDGASIYELLAAEKVTMLGGKVVTLSDSAGFIHDPDGITQEKIDWIKQLKNVRRGRISEYVDQFKGATYHEGKRPWGVPCDVALPCATQNELLGDDARELIKNGCIAVSEGANMPTNLEGVHVFKDAQILFAPGKAANAGGVAVSGLEMSQNSGRIS